MIESGDSTAGALHLPTNRQPSKAAGALFLVVQLILVLLAAEAAVLLLPLNVALGGGIGLKVLFLLRMPLLLGLAGWFLHRRGRNWSMLGLRRLPTWRTVSIVLACVGAVMAAGALANLLLLQVGIVNPHLVGFELLRGNWRKYVFCLLPVTWISAAFCEELLFRGYITDTLLALLGERRRSAIGLAIVGQAALFGLLHLYQGIDGAVSGFLVGLILGLAWIVSGRNLWPGIVAHGVIDSISMTAIYLSWAAA
jgi:membrane protease YdiL (CAAX protease family)